jgi:hypothetical protein
MRPSEFLLEFVYFLSLLPGFRCFFITGDRFTKGIAKIRKSIAFANKYLRGLAYVFETDIIFLRELCELGTFEEELRANVRATTAGWLETYLVLVRWMGCTQELTCSI